MDQAQKKSYIKKRRMDQTTHSKLPWLTQKKELYRTYLPEKQGIFLPCRKFDLYHCLHVRLVGKNLFITVINDGEKHIWCLFFWWAPKIYISRNIFGAYFSGELQPASAVKINFLSFALLLFWHSFRCGCCPA